MRTSLGVGVVVEKSFEGGREEMRKAGYGHLQIEALVKIIGMDDGQILFEGDR